MPSPASFLRLAVPVLIALAALVLMGHVVRRPEMLAGIEAPVGPAGWPRLMLAGVALFAALWFFLDLRTTLRGVKSDQLEDTQGASETSNNLTAWIGVVLALAYGVMIPIAGFALATVVFIMLWCMLGGIRKPVTVLLTSVIGTVTLLYLFVAVAKMPLDRGIGPIGDATIALYRLLGIY